MQTLSVLDIRALPLGRVGWGVRGDGGGSRDSCLLYFIENEFAPRSRSFRAFELRKFPVLEAEDE